MGEIRLYILGGEFSDSENLLEGTSHCFPIPFPKETGCEVLQKLIDPTRNRKREPTVNVRNEGKMAE